MINQILQDSLTIEKTARCVCNSTKPDIEEFVRKNLDKLDCGCWGLICFYQTLSEDFILEFQDKVNWNYISFNQKLSEEFIREFQDKVCWVYISCRQKLSEDFIREFQSRIDWHNIFRYQKLSKAFRKEFAHTL